MQLSHRWRLITLLIVFVTIGIFWNHVWIQPLKLIVVFLHEMSHAIGALITGGSVESIFISWDESGYTVTSGGDFLTIASAGYIGCILWGSLMLFASLSRKYSQYYPSFLGMLILFFTLRFSSDVDSGLYFLIILWSLLFIVTGILFRNISRYAMFYMGGITSLYGLFDLFDFFRGSIDTTDAGKIAMHYMDDPFLTKIMAYMIASLISIVSVWTLYRIIKIALTNKEETQEEAQIKDPVEKTPLEGMPTTPFIIDQRVIHELQKMMKQ